MDNQILSGKELQIDKTNWKPVKIGELANEISDRVENPESSDFERFVGLDNFVSGDLKIKSWASTKNLASAAKVFKAGDILFARRNAYLRRSSLVEFDGCCSGDAIVIRENPEKVVPSFLAFVLNSDRLWEYAISNAAGTMSQRVKWRDLAEYEFLLPPKDEQARLAELLWAMDEVIENEILILEKKNRFKHTFRKEVFRGFDSEILRSDSLISSDLKWKIRKVSEVCEICNSLRKPINKEERKKM